MSSCSDWTEKQFFRIDKQHPRDGAVHERSWKGTYERRRKWEQANASTKLVSGLRRCSPGYSRHAICKKAKQDLKKPNASPTSATGYGTWGTDRLTWSDEAYRIFGLKPQEGPQT
jgi:hypothetical protein